jgi:HAMP domain-containing protein
MGETVDAITVGAAVVATALAAYAAFLSRAATEAVRADVDLAKNVAKVDFAHRVEAELMAMYDELRAAVGPVDTDIEPVEPDLRRTVYRLVTIHSTAYSAFRASVLPEESWKAIDAKCSYRLRRERA